MVNGASRLAGVWMAWILRNALGAADLENLKRIEVAIREVLIVKTCLCFVENGEDSMSS